MPELTSAELRARLAAREILTHRLVERHGLTRLTARRAVLAVEERRHTRHADLVRAEAAEVMRPIREAFAQLLEQLRPEVEACARMMRTLANVLEPASQTTRRRNRPAWQSPYGPPTRRR
ncbi:hypothetical protein ACFW2X_06655 [Streptomyces antibioticus]|uniref:hypothetical protein n=1 Tax=Streptomyces antibioticus TaxID=1890 RepID=UPI0036955A7F